MAWNRRGADRNVWRNKLLSYNRIRKNGDDNEFVVWNYAENGSVFTLVVHIEVSIGTDKTDNKEKLLRP